MSRKLLPLLIIVLGIAGFLLLKATRPEPAEVSVSERSWLVQVQEIHPTEATPVLSLYGEVVAPDLQTITATLAGRIDRLPRAGRAAGKEKAICWWHWILPISNQCLSRPGPR